MLNIILKLIIIYYLFSDFRKFEPRLFYEPYYKPLSANPTKWSKILENQFDDNSRRIV